MNNPEQIRERVLAEALENIKKEVGSVLKNLATDLYSDYLPHVVADTEANIAYRVEGCIKNILQGKVDQVADSAMFYVNDTYGNDHLVSLTHYFDFKALCDTMGETIQTSRIKQLESEVESLKSQLLDSYRRF